MILVDFEKKKVILSGQVTKWNMKELDGYIEVNNYMFARGMRIKYEV